MTSTKGRKKERQTFANGGWVDNRLPDGIGWLLPDELIDRKAFKEWLAQQVGTYRSMSAFDSQDPARTEMLKILADFRDCLDGLLHFTESGGLPPSLKALLDERTYKHMQTTLRHTINRNDMLKLKLFVEDTSKEVAGWKQPPGVKRNERRDKLFMNVTWRMWKDTGMQIEMVAAGKLSAAVLDACGITGLPQEDETVRRKLRTLLDKYWTQ